MRSVPPVLAAFTILSACTPMLGDRTVVRPASGYEPVFAAYQTGRELQKQKSTQQVFGWQLEVGAGRARYFSCASAESCGSRPVDIAASSVLAVKTIGRAAPTLDDGSTGSETEVYELTLKVDEAVTRGGAAYDSNRGLMVR